MTPIELAEKILEADAKRQARQALDKAATDLCARARLAEMQANRDYFWPTQKEIELAREVMRLSTNPPP